MNVPPQDRDVTAMIALAGLAGMGPSRLRRVYGALGAPQAWAALHDRTADGASVAGALGGGPGAWDLVRAWRLVATGVDAEALADHHRHLAISVLTAGDGAWPTRLEEDEDAPVVLFTLGDLRLLAQPTVAIVGTRSCTHDGRAIARQLATDLAAAGVAVISGLAMGIDGAAHRGALAAPGGATVGVVATGLDVHYPRANAGLWDEVAARGLLVSEAPLGTQVERWRFPARNRIVAGLADAVVVVESHEHGGSMHTVEAALERGRPVLAVPGAVRSPASKGTNDLLRSGATPCCDAADVLFVLGLHVDPRPVIPPANNHASLMRNVSAAGLAVLEAIGPLPRATDEIISMTALPVADVLAALEELADAGLVERGAGWWGQMR